MKRSTLELRRVSLWRGLHHRRNFNFAPPEEKGELMMRWRWHPSSRGARASSRAEQSRARPRSELTCEQGCLLSPSSSRGHTSGVPKSRFVPSSLLFSQLRIYSLGAQMFLLTTRYCCCCCCCCCLWFIHVLPESKASAWLVVMLRKTVRE